MARILLLFVLLVGCSSPPQSFVHVELTDAHEAAPCSGCHGDEFEGPVQTECVDCHAAPAGHVERACDRCHDGEVWNGDAYEHELILPHQPDVEACDACHTEGDHNRARCLDCHDHRHEAVSPPHMYAGIPGYQFKSDACIRCHPDGRVH
jgi:hypothetical protein